MKRVYVSCLVMSAIGGFLVLAACGLSLWFVGPTVARQLREGTRLAAQTEDYAVARKAFQTHLTRRGPSPQPEGEPATIPRGVHKVVYDSGNLPLSAYVDDPPSDGEKRPAVLFLHGGFAFGGDDLEVPQPFRDAGFIVMVPVLRGENNQPGDFTLYYDEVDDVLAAADALANLPYVDPKRIFVSGHSAGGTLAMLAAMSSNRFRAAAPLSGTCDQHIMDKFWIPFDLRVEREFQMRSPVAYAASFKCPVRIIYGSEEQWTVAPSQTTAQRAKQAGQDVEVLVVPGDHSSLIPEGIRRSIEFFEQIPASP